MKKLILAIIVIAFTSCEGVGEYDFGTVEKIEKGSACKSMVYVHLQDCNHFYYQTNDNLNIGDTIYFKKK